MTSSLVLRYKRHATGNRKHYRLIVYHIIKLKFPKDCHKKGMIKTK